MTQSELLKAAEKGNLDTLKSLVTGLKFKSLEARGKDGYTALMKAAYWGERACLAYLIDKGANMNATGLHGETALHLAAGEHKALSCVVLLLEKGADPNVKDTNGQTVMHVVEEQEHIDEKLIMEDSWAPDKAAKTLAAAVKKKLEDDLTSAAEAGDLDTLKRLVEDGVNLEASDAMDGMTAVMFAAQGGKLECLDFLIAKGAKLNARVALRKQTALHIAAKGGHAPCVDSLLKAGAKAGLKDYQGKTAMDIKRRVWAQELGLLQPLREALKTDGRTYGKEDDEDVLRKVLELLEPHIEKQQAKRRRLN